MSVDAKFLATGNARTRHQLAVDELTRGIGKIIPSKPTAPDKQKLMVQIRLILEEAQELIDSSGLAIASDLTRDIRKPIDLRELVLYAGDKPVDLVGIADDVADLHVVVAGVNSICGIADAAILNEVNDNNLLKIANGHLDPVSGKFIKPPNHPKPDIKKHLLAQGWEEPAA
jgi:predicted HAD superfamily Cof-like phosphohydrolase